ncbi:dihydroorotate dehydrogenase, partial [Candidatus Falkowbacteria bacterium]|nr:dihydroorotate dehydrogenase [Candidatus Falkowbacteria bacterium]
TPNVTDIVAIAKSVVRAGADAISLINTLKSRAKIRRGPGEGKWIEGGLSGPAIKPIALRMVSDVAKANLGVSIIGMGGISNIEDTLDFFESGADAIAIGTANFVNPNVMIEIIGGLWRYLGEKGYSNIKELKP